MVLPYGIVEQYSYFREFLDSSASCLHIEQPFYETPAILDIAVQDWVQEHGSDVICVQYYTSDSCSKRVLTNKKSGRTKRVLLDLVYISGWVWRSLPRFVTSVRTGL